MRIVRITAELGATVNRGDFNSLRMGEALVADLDKDDDPVASSQKLFDQVRADLDLQYKIANGEASMVPPPPPGSRQVEPGEIDQGRL